MSKQIAQVAARRPSLEVIRALLEQVKSIDVSKASEIVRYHLGCNLEEVSTPDWDGTIFSGQFTSIFFLASKK